MPKKIPIILIISAILIYATNGLAAFKLPDTGQTKCYQGVNPYAEISCEGTGQDGEYTINPLSYTDNGNGTVTDNNTGLVWQKEDDGVIYNWYEAAGIFDAVYNPTSMNICGELRTGGYSDWRLPSKKELGSILNYDIPYPTGPTIDPVFTNTVAALYWTSTQYARFSARPRGSLTSALAAWMALTSTNQATTTSGACGLVSTLANSLLKTVMGPSQTMPQA